MSERSHDSTDQQHHGRMGAAGASSTMARRGFLSGLCANAIATGIALCACMMVFSEDGPLRYAPAGVIAVAVIWAMAARGQIAAARGAVPGGVLGYCLVWAVDAAAYDTTGQWGMGFVLLVPGVTVGLILAYAIALVVWGRPRRIGSKK